MRIIIYFSLLWLVMACNSTEQQEIGFLKQLREGSNQAIAEKDTTAMASFWTDDVHVISSRNAEVSGKEKLRHLFAKEFAAKKNLLYIRTPENIRVFSDWGMASEEGHWTGYWDEPDGKVEISGRYFAKWHRLKEGWKIRSEVFVPLTCKGSAFCSTTPEI
jgi:ketosteroid isomerase-like protein